MSKLKEHIKKNESTYKAIGCGFLFAGFTYTIMKRNPELLSGSGSKLLSGSEVRSFSLFSKVNGNQINKAVTTIHTGDRGHSGFVTKCLDTGELFRSQKAAARAFDIPESILSSHLNGKFTDALGYKFERVGVL